MRPDDVFALVLDLRSFSVICPLDAEAGDNISVTAPAPALSLLQGTSDFNADEPVLLSAILSASEAVKLAGPLGKGDNGELTSGYGRASLVPMPSSDLSNAKDFDSASIPLTSNEQLPASIVAMAPTAEKRATDAAESSSAVFTEMDTSSNSVPSAGLETASDSKLCDTAIGCKATKCDVGTTECYDAIVSDRHEVYEACATIINNSSCDTHLQGFGKSSGLTAAVDSAHTLDASSTAMCERKSEGCGVGDSAGCALCTCALKSVSNPDDVKVNGSGSSGALCLCSVCGEDPRGNNLPPIAVRIPLATPSMTVLSSIRYEPFI